MASREKQLSAQAADGGGRQEDTGSDRKPAALPLERDISEQRRKLERVLLERRSSRSDRLRAASQPYPKVVTTPPHMMPKGPPPPPTNAATKPSGEDIFAPWEDRLRRYGWPNTSDSRSMTSHDHHYHHHGQYGYHDGGVHPVTEPRFVRTASQEYDTQNEDVRAQQEAILAKIQNEHHFNMGTTWNGSGMDTSKGQPKQPATTQEFNPELWLQGGRSTGEYTTTVATTGFGSGPSYSSPHDDPVSDSRNRDQTQDGTVAALFSSLGGDWGPPGSQPYGLSLSSPHRNPHDPHNQHQRNMSTSNNHHDNESCSFAVVAASTASPQRPSSPSHSGTSPRSDVPRQIIVPQQRTPHDRPPHRHKHGLVEMYPGTYINIHSTRKTWEAISKGQATIVKCHVCRKRFQLSNAAKVLYCTSCGSLTPTDGDLETAATINILQQQGQQQGQRHARHSGSGNDDDDDGVPGEENTGHKTPTQQTGARTTDSSHATDMAHRYQQERNNEDYHIALRVQRHEIDAEIDRTRQNDQGWETSQDGDKEKTADGLRMKPLHAPHGGPLAVVTRTRAQRQRQERSPNNHNENDKNKKDKTVHERFAI